MGLQLCTFAKNNLNLRLKIDDVTRIRVCPAFDYPDIKNAALHLLQVCHAQFLCGDSDYFWDSVVKECQRGKDKCRPNWFDTFFHRLVSM